jgi:hypothetical protein
MNAELQTVSPMALAPPVMTNARMEEGTRRRTPVIMEPQDIVKSKGATVVMGNTGLDGPPVLVASYAVAVRNAPTMAEPLGRAFFSVARARALSLPPSVPTAPSAPPLGLDLTLVMVRGV